jgi:hypothetical protein
MFGTTLNGSFTNNTVINVAPSAGASFPFITVTTAVLTNFRLNGNQFWSDDTGAGTRELFTAIGTNNGIVAVGNIFHNDGGSTASTTVVPTTPNLGF